MTIPQWLKDSVEYGIPLVTFIVASFSVFLSLRTKKAQTKADTLYDETLALQKKLNEIYISKANEQEIMVKTPVVRVKLVRGLKHGFKIRISNEGIAKAYNVDFEFVEGSKIKVMRNLTPFEYLNSKQHIEEHILNFDYTDEFNEIVLKWEDLDGNHYKWSTILTIN